MTGSSQSIKNSSSNNNIQRWHKAAANLISYYNRIDKSDIAYRTASVSIAATVALGEALIAVYFMGLVGLFPVLAVAIPAFAVNFFLFNGDTYSFLKLGFKGQLFRDHERDYDGNIILDSDGNPKQVNFKGWKKWLLRVVMGLSVFAGVLCGVVQLNSVLTTFGGLIFGLSAAVAISAPPVGLMAIAVVISIVSMIANAALLYNQIEVFIREREYQQYSDTFKSILGLQKDKGKQYSKLWMLYHGLFAALGLAGAVGIFVVSFGIYRSQSYKFFNEAVKLSLKSSNYLALLVSVPGQLVNGFFYSRNILKLVQKIENSLKKLAIIPLAYQFSKIFYGQQLAQNNMVESQEHFSFQKIWKDLILLPVSIGFFGVLLYCCYINGVSQGRGAMSEPRSTEWFTKLLKMPQWLAEKVAFTLMAAGSTSANAFACLDGIFEIFGITDKKLEDASRFICQKTGNAKDAVVKSVFGFGRNAVHKELDFVRNRRKPKSPNTDSDMGPMIEMSEKSARVGFK